MLLAVPADTFFLLSSSASSQSIEKRKGSAYTPPGQQATKISPAA
jgi:hypothetical protein